MKNTRLVAFAAVVAMLVCAGPANAAPAAMTDQEFTAFMASVDDATGAKAKLEVVRAAAASNWFTTDQVIEVIPELLGYTADTRVQGGVALYPRVVDRKNFYRVYSELPGSKAKMLREQVAKISVPQEPAASPSSTPGKEKCYQITADKKGRYARTPELLCLTQGPGKSKYVLTLKTGVPPTQKIVIFNFDLLERARCSDCNKDTFGVAAPANSSFNSLKIRFDGERDLKKGTEKGVLHIGTTDFRYRSMR